MMQTPSKILVPVDFSASSRAALEYASLLGARFGAEIDVLHVFHAESDPSSRQALLTEFIHTDAGRRMMEWLASCELAGDVEPHGRVAPGERRDVPDAILAAVQSGSYDLVVMGTHGRQGLSLRLRSSVTEKVMSQAPCPVLMIRGQEGTTLAIDPARDDLEMTNVWSWPS